tara:strand:- start:688 stop:978 length:291 start_codon:yes stop_codon:yes gene_type:complete
MAKKIKSLKFVGARWQDRNGNTYHKVKVYVNGRLIGTSPIKYGYGTQYLYTGKAMLKEKGYLKSGSVSNWTLVKDMKIKVEDNVTDYPKKRDLTNF